MLETIGATTEPSRKTPAPETGLCYECGNQIRPKAKFCPKCGADLVMANK